MSPEAEALAMLRGQLIEICFGTTFVVIGLAAMAVAAIRRRTGGRAVVWLGLWSTIYGILGLAGAPAFVAALPRWVQAAAPGVRCGFTYLTIFVATMAWRELSLGKLRRILGAIALVGLAIAVAGISIFVFTGSPDKLIPLNNLLAVFDLLLLLTVIIVPSLSQKYLMLPSRGVLAVGSTVFILEAVFVNLSRPFGYEILRVWDSLAFAVLLFSLGYVALQIVFANERRLLSIESELAVARQLQFSILPTTTPDLRNLRIAAVYEPMTEVAGDFYEYLPVDEYRVGFLVADVSGHGVPAALIASMIKVAAQTVTAWANDPGEVLRRLRDVLLAQLQGQFVSVAYLWIDTVPAPRAILPLDIRRFCAGAQPTAHSPVSRVTACCSGSHSIPTTRCEKFLSRPMTVSCSIPMVSANLRTPPASRSATAGWNSLCARTRRAPPQNYRCCYWMRSASGSPHPLPSRTTSLCLLLTYFRRCPACVSDSHCLRPAEFSISLM